MAKESKPQQPVTFAEYLSEPHKYVRRGELTNIVDKMIRLNRQYDKQQNWWNRLKRKLARY